MSATPPVLQAAAACRGGAGDTAPPTPSNQVLHNGRLNPAPPSEIPQRGGQWQARLEPAPGTTVSRRKGAVGDTGQCFCAPDGPTGHRRGRSSGDPRPKPDGILTRSQPGFLEEIAAG